MCACCPMHNNITCVRQARATVKWETVNFEKNGTQMHPFPGWNFNGDPCAKRSRDHGKHSHHYEADVCEPLAGHALRHSPQFAASSAHGAGGRSRSVSSDKALRSAHAADWGTCNTGESGSAQRGGPARLRDSSLSCSGIRSGRSGQTRSWLPPGSWDLREDTCFARS